MGPDTGPVVTGHRTITLDKIFLKMETQVNCAMCIKTALYGMGTLL